MKRKMTIDINPQITGGVDELDITVWETYTYPEDKENKKVCIATTILPLRALKFFNEKMYSYEESLDEKEEEGEYDGSLQQAHDDYERTELNAIIRNQ